MEGESISIARLFNFHSYLIIIFSSQANIFSLFQLNFQTNIYTKLNYFITSLSFFHFLVLMGTNLGFLNVRIAPQQGTAAARQQVKKIVA